jgi:hypothetical protein
MVHQTLKVCLIGLPTPANNRIGPTRVHPPDDQSPPHSSRNIEARIRGNSHLLWPSIAPRHSLRGIVFATGPILTMDRRRSAVLTRVLAGHHGTVRLAVMRPLWASTSGRSALALADKCQIPDGPLRRRNDSPGVLRDGIDVPGPTGAWIIPPRVDVPGRSRTWIDV